MWRKLKVWFRAVVTGLIVAGVPTFVWAALGAVNLQLTPRMPWSVPLMAVLLWAYWRYVRGDGPPRRLSTIRNKHLRAGSLSPGVWRMALLAGGSAVAAVWASFAALRGVLHIAAPPNDLTRFPVWTIFAAIVMGSAVAGVAEEAGFRGYMQVPMERAYGPGVAIATTSVLFTLVHLTHGSRIFPFLPFFLAVAVAYGLLAFLTGSILPGMILHFAGDVLMFTMRYLVARQGGPGIAPTGTISPAFAILSLAFAAVAVLTYRLLARETRIVASTPSMAAVS